MPAIGVADLFLPATREKSVRMDNKGIQLAGTRKKPALALLRATITILPWLTQARDLNAEGTRAGMLKPVKACDGCCEMRTGAHRSERPRKGESRVQLKARPDGQRFGREIL